MTAAMWYMLDNFAQCPPAWFTYSDNLEGEEIMALYRWGLIRVNWKDHQAQITDYGLVYWKYQSEKGEAD